MKIEIEKRVVRNGYLLTFLSCSAVGLNFLDPVNWPKQIALLAVLSILVSTSMQSLISLRIKDSISLKLLLAAFILVTVSSAVGAENLTRFFWGTWGRNNGVVALACFLTLALMSFVFASAKGSLELLIKTLSLAFIPASVYGLIQSFATDPIDWSAKDQVFSFFGNPNFASSILALSSVASFFAFRLSKGEKISFLYLTQSVSALVVVWNTDSIQGLVVVAISMVVYVMARLRQVVPLTISSAIVLVSGLLVFLGFIGRGPLGSLIYQYTMQLRLFYWETGIKMGLSNPIFGVGVDSYGDFYRDFRTLEIAKTTSVDLTVNNAHNSLIQVFATLGLIGLIGFLLVIVPALVAALRLLYNKTSSESEIAVAIIFICSFLVSLISIDNLAVAIVHWVLIGTLLYHFEQMRKGVSERSDSIPSKATKVKGPSDALISIARVILLVTLGGLSFAASSADRELVGIFKTQVSAQDQQAVDKRWKDLYRIAKSGWNLQETHYAYLVEGIQAVNVWPIAYKVAESGLEKYPNDFNILDKAAVLAEKMGKFSEGESLRKRQLDLDPRHSLVWVYLARDYYEQGRYQEARSALAESRKFDVLLDDRGLQYRENLENLLRDK